jgi:Subtilase family/PatG Domain
LLVGLSPPESVRAALAVVNLHPLMEATGGDPSIVIGIIDGPVDLSHPAFASSSVSTVRSNHAALCQNAASSACFHGTAVAGVLTASRGVPAPAIAPACTALLYPVFPEGPSGAAGLPATTPGALTRAIMETVDAGAKIINLSLGLLTSDITPYPELDEASEYACKRGVILVAASGNQGRIGFLPLLNHPWMIPVAACDLNGRVTPESNLSPSIGIRGLRAPGVDVSTTAPASRYIPVTGTSVAAAFVTGGLALLWSQFPGATASEIRQVALQAAHSPRRSIIPPLFDAEAARQLFRTTTTRREVVMEDQKRQDEPGQAQEGQPVTVLHREATRPAGPRHAALSPHLTPGRGRVVTHVGAGAPCPTCAVGAQETAAAAPPTFIYAIGSVKTRFPSPAVEKEFAQSLVGGATANLTDQQVFYNTLRANRYLANEVCWVFSIEGAETYILLPREPVMLEQFV